MTGVDFVSGSGVQMVFHLMFWNYYGFVVAAVAVDFLSHLQNSSS